MATLPSFHGLPDTALFLGFDCSTQSMKATAVDSKLNVVASECVQFESALPHYKTKDGVHRKPGDVVTSPPLMWAEALELVLGKLRDRSFPFHQVASLSGSGQQHGSVFWKKGARKILKEVSSSSSSGGSSGGLLWEQLGDAFAVVDSPIWMDSSTTKQCQHIEQACGGPSALAALTGSRAYERFTGAQIRKVYEEDREAYDACERISLVSSFMASLLIGDYAAIDHSDGAGMNLMDLRTRTWAPTPLQATADGLEDKLGALAAPHAIAGNISPYFVHQYGFHPECNVVQWSGDNPCSLAGLALSRPGDVAISLGTSDTVFGVVADATPGLEGVVFPNPVDPNTYVTMLVIKNGSLTRQGVRDACANASWDEFNRLLAQSPPLNDGKLGFFYTEPEIVPPLPAGTHRFCPGPDGTTHVAVDAFEPPTEVRALVEGQVMSMRSHAEKMGMPSPPRRIIATGGASANTLILSLLASLFGANVYAPRSTDSASAGAAVRAAHGYACKKAENGFVPFSSLVALGGPDSCVHLRTVAQPHSDDTHNQYGNLIIHRNNIEQQLLTKYNPSAVIVPTTTPTPPLPSLPSTDSGSE